MYKMVKQCKLEAPNKVLVVDDELIVRNIVAKVLNRYLGCEVYTASSSREAISFIQSGGFELFLIDLAMPDISGIELIKMIHKLQLQIPIVVITGNGSDKDIAEANRLGVNQIIYKPFKIVTFLEIIADVLLEKKEVIDYV
jgi:DNA-binding NtrC family response regulator